MSSRARILRPLVPVFLSFLMTAPAYGRLALMRETDSAKRVVVAKDDGTSRRAVSPEDEWGLYPALSADGKTVAYSLGQSPDDLAIVTQDLETGERKTWSGRGLYLHADFSGHGQKLAFSGPLGSEGAQRIGVVDLSSATPAEPSVETLPAEGGAYFPQLNSSGDFVIFQENQEERKTLVKFHLNSREREVLTPDAAVSMAPALSTDDRRLAYTSRRDGRWNLYVRNLADGEEIQVTASAHREFAPTFKPDGSLVFAADYRGRFELYRIPADKLGDRDRESIKPLVRGDASYYAPSFSGETGLSQDRVPGMIEPPRSSFGAVHHNGRIYVAGGHEGPEHTYPPESFSDRVEVFDPATGDWSSLPPLTLPRHGFDLAAYGDSIYAFGGFAYSDEHNPNWKSVDLIERFDTKTQTWEVIGHLPRPRSSNIVARVGTKVYLIGGWNSTPKFDGDFEGRFHPEIDVFDLETETVSTLDVRLPDPLRRALSAVVIDESIYLIGGISEGASQFSLIDRITEFDTTTKTWQEREPLPFATFAPAAGAIGDRLFVFGGMFKTGEMAYDYVTHVYANRLGDEAGWQHTGRHLHQKKGFSQVVESSAERLYLLGGHTYEGDEDHPVTTVETFSAGSSF